jgi:hypothetical protein
VKALIHRCASAHIKQQKGVPNDGERQRYVGELCEVCVRFDYIDTPYFLLLSLFSVFFGGLYVKLFFCAEFALSRSDKKKNEENIMR